MKELTMGAAVRTNDRWRAFFKTDDIISGIIVGNWEYDRDTAVVRKDNGDTELIHIDWLEPDKKMRGK